MVNKSNEVNTALICGTVLIVTVVISITVIARVIVIVKKRGRDEKSEEEYDSNVLYRTYYCGVNDNIATDQNPRYNEDGGEAVVTDANPLYYQLSISRKNNPGHNDDAATTAEKNIYCQL